MPVLQNLMEEVVFTMIDELLVGKNVCSCEQCRLDIAALALNNLPSRYVVTAKGTAYTAANLQEIQKYVDVAGAIKQAIKLVQEHPRHNIKTRKK